LYFFFHHKMSPCVDAVLSATALSANKKLHKYQTPDRTNEPKLSLEVFIFFFSGLLEKRI